jgi:replicative DNA helicase
MTAPDEGHGLDSSQSDIAAEQAVLGAMMTSPAALVDCLDILQTGDFYRPAHQDVYAEMSRMSDDGMPVDILTLQERLDAARVKYSGATYLHTLYTAVPSVANATWYAERVRDLAARRALTSAGHRISVIALNPELPAAERADEAGRALDAAVIRDSGTGAVPVGDLLPGYLEMLDSGDTGPKVTTGWVDLNRIIPGFRPGELITIGARPGMGKTAVMVGLAEHAAVREQRPVLLRSLEMSRDEIMQRLVSIAAHVPLHALREGKLGDQEWERIKNVYPRIAAAPLYISDDPYPKLHDLRSDLRGMRRRGAPAELFMLDYLQLMTSSDKTESRQLEVAALARGLKLMAKEFAVPVITGSQLNREAEKRADKRPQLADMRESGAVEQDSDIVILLYRDDVYNRESKDAGKIEMHVAKHRNGPTGTATLAFRAPYAHVANAWKYSPEEN